MFGFFTGAAPCGAAISAPNTFWKVLRGVPVATTRQLSVADFLPKGLNQQRAEASTAAMTALTGLRPKSPDKYPPHCPERGKGCA